VRRDSLREGEDGNRHLEGGHHVERDEGHDRGGYPSVVCWKEEVCCRALSQQGFMVFVNSEQASVTVRDGWTVFGGRKS
jgi:hypothetical protein